MASRMVNLQSQGTMEMVLCGKRGWVSSETWVSVVPVCGGSEEVVSEGPCTPEKALSSHGKSSSLTVLVSGGGGAGECLSRVETPKSTPHKIPDVDVDLCPPAPKKPRGVRRLVFTCSTECENANARQKLGLSPGYSY